jgi:hypothetical protein
MNLLHLLTVLLCPYQLYFNLVYIQDCLFGYTKVPYCYMTNTSIFEVCTEKDHVTLCIVFTVYHHAALFSCSLPFIWPPVVILWLLKIKPFSKNVCHSWSCVAPQFSLQRIREKFWTIFTPPAIKCWCLLSYLFCPLVSSSLCFQRFSSYYSKTLQTA